ncbi:MAG: ComF family protein [Pseudobdellovibrio sp.]
MNFLKQYLLSPVCLVCGSLLNENHLFCRNCFNFTKSFLEENSDIENHIHLYTWKPSQADFFEQLIYRLKYDQAVEALRYYSELLALKLAAEFDLKEFSGLIPIPTAQHKSNHAFIIAETLSRKTGLPIFDILLKEKSSRSQKTLSRVERQKQDAFRLKTPNNEQFTSGKSELKRYVFVDDVLTTGQSYFKCSELVFWSKQNVIATLFFRAKLN